MLLMNDAAVSTRLQQPLIDSFRHYVDRQEPLALLTVLATDGSTYSKAGGQILVGTGGRCHGLLSGGCLEQDLAERASTLMQSGACDVVEYDLRDDDEVFGLGVGCEGLLRIHIQPLLPAHGYRPFADWLEQIAAGRVAKAELDLGQAGVSLHLCLRGPHEVLLLGAGQDALPLLHFCRELGWRVTVSDHRPAHVAALKEQHDGELHCIDTAELEQQLDLDRYDAAIIMSHHLVSDRQYLCSLARASVGFVGLLGPPHRKARLLGEIGAEAKRLDGRLHGPVGRRIGGRGPAAIALEVTAELQAYFSSAARD